MDQSYRLGKESWKERQNVVFLECYQKTKELGAQRQSDKGSETRR
jgi:hypothetical protein